LANLNEMQVGRVWLPLTYFALWMCRLMGWMPELGRCVVCGLVLDPRDGSRGTVWYSPTGDGVTCSDDRRPGSLALSAPSVVDAMRIFRSTVAELAQEDWPKSRGVDLRRFAIETLERHLERRLVSARALGRA
jgi:DNA repair protein RecO (recombination protein O)